MRGRTARELQITTPDIQFTEWYAWDDIKNIPCGDQRGVYIIARFDKKPDGPADHNAKEIIYIGETHGKSQSIYKRLNTFFKAARVGNMIHKHSGGNRFHREFNGDLTNIYVAAFSTKLANKDHVNPFILYVERKLIWDYIVQYATLPRCNAY